MTAVQVPPEHGGGFIEIDPGAPDSWPQWFADVVGETKAQMQGGQTLSFPVEAFAGLFQRPRPVTAAICVPWRPGVPSREVIWDERVRPTLEATGLPIYTGDSDPDKPFNRSQARNNAAAAALAAHPELDVLVFNDADTLLPIDQFEAAIARAAETGGAVVGFGRAVLHTPDGETWVRKEQATYTTTVIAGRIPTGDIAISRRAWDIVGGWDERFTRWGFEDYAMGVSLHMLAGLEFLPGDAHYWDHERRPDEAIKPSPDKPMEAWVYNGLELMRPEDAARDALRQWLAMPGGPLA